MRSQSAVEFLTTYSWAFLILGIFIASVIILVSGPSGVFSYAPSYCYIEPSLPCIDAVVIINSTATKFILVFQNKLGASLSFPSNALTVFPQSFSNVSYGGGCIPVNAPQNTQVTCNATLGTFKPSAGTQLSPKFSLTYKICTTTCAAQTYNTSGVALTVAAPLQSVFFNVQLVTNTLTGNIILNGVSYGSNTVVGFISGVPYTIFAQIPTGYFFSGWTTTNGVTVNTNTQSTSVTTNSIGLLQANFYSTTTSTTSTSTSSTSTSSTSTTSTTSTSTTSTSSTSSTTSTSTSTSTSTTSTTTTTISYMFCVGGIEINPVFHNQVYYAPISSTSIGTWTATANYPLAAGDMSCVISNVYIYCVGGQISSGWIATSYYAPVSSTGVGAWSHTTDFPATLADAACSISGGYIYCVGGRFGSGSFSNEAYYAPISGSGIGTWTATTGPPINTGTIEACPISNGYIYCSGGGQSYYAPVSSSGIGAWTSTNYAGGIVSVANGGYIYSIDGIYACPTLGAATYYATATSSGIGTSTLSSTTPVQSSGPSCTQRAGYMYCEGGGQSSGCTGLAISQSTYYAQETSTGLGAWSLGTGYPLAVGNNPCPATP